ncbi:MAG: ElyC/SanA/YdcF family protein [Opitutaceae bacterium]|nr:ElyC/SanA/YdcF family protein [Opitutaceae bacterium]
MRLFRPATVYVPTLAGWVVLAALLLAPPVWWGFKGEAFLSVHAPVAADVLVVEGWIGRDGIQFAAKEYHKGGYRYVVAVGVEGEGWRPEDQSDFAKAAANVMAAHGVPRSQILEVSLQRILTNRTYASIKNAREALEATGFTPKGVNVVTRGCHARRSRLVVSRVFDPVPAGTVTFWREAPTEVRWWESTARAADFFSESLKFFLALLWG